jgi:acetyltransferase-like isoleucine patch superfamily enzyme
MLLIKGYYRLLSILFRIFYLILYHNSLNVGKHVYWRKSFKLMIDKGAHVKIHNGCFFNNFCSINANQLVEIGENSLFGENVKIYDHNHRFNHKNTLVKNQGFSNGHVIIGDNCWIGSNVVILKDTKIGDNTVVSAGSVIKGDIPSDVIVRNVGGKLKFDSIRYKE